MTRSAPHPRRLGAVLLAVAAVLLGAPAPAGAHAVLVESEPADGTALEDAPGEVTLRFNESVQVAEGGLRVHDGEAERIDEGVTRRGEEGTVSVALPDDLPDGGYLVVYRVVSADNHPVNGVVGFTVGDAEGVTDEVAADLLGGDALVGTVGAALRGLGYLGTLLAAGAVAFALAVARRGDDRRRAGRVGAAAAAVALAATVLALPVQTMAASGVGPLDALTPTAAGQTLRSSFGDSWLLRVAALGLLAPVLRRGGPRWLLLAAAVAAPASYLLDGHSRSMEPAWLLVAGDAVHLAAGTVWFGGLLLLALAVRSRSVDDDPVGAARLVARFSAVALWAVVAIVVSGAAMAWALVRVPGALTSTGYGWTLLAKVTVVLVALAAAAHNRFRLVPAVVARRAPAGAGVDAGTEVAGSDPDARLVRRSRAAWAQLRTTLLVEVVLLVVVLAVTGFLAVQRPAADAAGVTGIYDTRVALTDELDLELVVDPNRAGRTNAVHLYVLDETGRPAADLDDVRLELTYEPEDIGPFGIEPFPAGPGHWIANVDELTFPGPWRMTVTAGVDRFEEERVEVVVPVR